MVELVRLTVELGVQWNDGKMAAARARVSAGVFISRGEGCRGERRRGVRLLERQTRALSREEGTRQLGQRGGPGGGVVAPVPSL